MFKAVFDIEKVLNHPEINEVFESFKTSNWKKLGASQRLEAFNRLNNIIKKSIGIFFLSFMSVDYKGYDTSTLKEGDPYNNIKLLDFGMAIFSILDIDYNQYKTLHDYLYTLRLYMQDQACDDMLEIKGLDEETIEEWKKIKKTYKVDNAAVTLDRDEEDNLSEFLPYKLEAKKFADDLLVKIIKNNYDSKKNYYDEEVFMADYDFLRDEIIDKTGSELLEDDNVKNKELIESCEYVERIIDETKKCSDFSQLPDRNVFMSVYPSIIKCYSTKELAKLYKELVYRLTDNKMNIWSISKYVVVNYHLYDEETFRTNAFNILMYEMLARVDAKLHKSNKSDLQTIQSVKKECVLDWIEKIDKEFLMFDFGPYKYQPLRDLLREETIDETLAMSKKGETPYRRGR